MFNKFTINPDDHSQQLCKKYIMYIPLFHHLPSYEGTQQVSPSKLMMIAELWIYPAYHLRNLETGHLSPCNPLYHKKRSPSDDLKWIHWRYEQRFCNELNAPNLNTWRSKKSLREWYHANQCKYLHMSMGWGLLKLSYFTFIFGRCHCS